MELNNNYFKLILDDLKKLWTSLDIAQKFGILALTVVTLVAATFFLVKAMEPNWAVLYTDLSEPDAVAITDSLKKNGYTYKIADDQKTILVPAKQKDELRVYVAENDLIKNSNPGFELLDDMQLGSTDFKNKLTRQRIFQGELTRSIEKMNGIKNVRIQIAEPDRSIFEQNDEEPTASVMLILDPGYKLTGSQVKAIKNLVAYAIPRLTPEKVFITDQSGNALGDENGKNSNDMESFKTNFEKDTSQKITTVLEKIMGKGNATVQVSADINFDSAKSTIESYIPLNDKGQGVLTASQTEDETYANPNGQAAPAGAAAGGKNLNYSKNKSSTNYSVSKEVKQVVYAPGSVKRMTIAVAVNKILTAKEKDEIQNLVLSASGADYTRGDVITVSSLQFESLADDKAAQDQMQKDQQRDDAIELWTTKIGPPLVVLVLGLAALIVIKSLMKGGPSAGTMVEQREELYAPRAYEAQLPSINEEAAPIERESLPQIETHLDPELERTRMELNDTILADPSEAAKLLTSYIRD